MPFDKNAMSSDPIRQPMYMMATENVNLAMIGLPEGVRARACVCMCVCVSIFHISFFTLSLSLYFFLTLSLSPSLPQVHLSWST